MDTNAQTSMALRLRLRSDVLWRAHMMSSEAYQRRTREASQYRTWANDRALPSGDFWHRAMYYSESSAGNHETRAIVYGIASVMAASAACILARHEDVFAAMDAAQYGY